MMQLPPQPPAIISDWKCKDSQFGKWCDRLVGDIKEVRIVQDGDADNAYQFAFADMDSAKVNDGAIGISAVVGWPSWFPIFNRKRVYSFAYPVTLEGKGRVK